MLAPNNWWGAASGPMSACNPGGTGCGEGDLNTARAATEIATSAAPYEEIPRLDLAAIAGAAGHRQEAANCSR
jgi:hypothetical protein